MREKLILLVLLLSVLVIGVPGARAQQLPCLNHAGYSGQADQVFAKNQNPNAKDRFEFWFAHLNELQKAQENKNPEWKIHIDWSIQDTGFVEPDIQKTWAIDLHIINQCICPPGQGRKTAMQIAIKDAKADDCQTAGLITVSTQLHNPEAIDVFRKTDAQEFCKYLKSK